MARSVVTAAWSPSAASLRPTPPVPRLAHLVRRPVPNSAPHPARRYMGRWYQTYANLLEDLTFENASLCDTADYARALGVRHREGMGAVRLQHCCC